MPLRAQILCNFADLPTLTWWFSTVDQLNELAHNPPPCSRRSLCQPIHRLNAFRAVATHQTLRPRVANPSAAGCGTENNCFGPAVPPHRNDACKLGKQ